MNKSEEFVQNAVIQLKQLLERLNIYNDVSLSDCKDDDLLVANIETWLNKLPVHITNADDFKILKSKFIRRMKYYRALGLSDETIVKEIIRFLQSLPIKSSSKPNAMYFNDRANHLVQDFKLEPTFKETPFNGHEFIKSVGQAIRDWAKLLPIEPEYNTRKLKQVIEEITFIITTIIKQSNNSLISKHYQQIKEEVEKKIKRIPLRHECTSEQQLLKMSFNLVRNIKDIHFKCNANIKIDHINRTNVTVYGVSVKNTSESSGKDTIPDNKKSNLKEYTRQVVNQISDWLSDLNLQINQNEGLKSLVINDLASDIIDRYKYLQLSPQNRKSAKVELELMKFQIFKWINKLNGDESIDTIAHADDLMKRIQSIPEPVITKSRNEPQFSSLKTKSMRTNAPVTKEEVDKLPNYGPATGESTFREESSKLLPSKIGSLGEIASPRSPNPREAIFEKYQNIFKEKMYELAIDTSTPESAQLAELARTALYNGIIKIFFRLKSDPDIADDYGYFEFILEGKLDEMLNVLPQTDEMVKTRNSWKLDIMSNAMDMLKDLQISDRESFRQKLKNEFNRKFARNFKLEQCVLLQQGFLAEVVEAYLLETRYKENDTLKANIYKHKLMKKIDALANHLTKQHHTEFRFLKNPQLVQHAMKVLDSVPIPKDDVLDEVTEILLAEEIEKWYKELPTTPYINEFDQIFRKRMIDLLARRLCEIEKNQVDLDTSKEIQMKHEISNFLQERGKLAKDEDLNINFMVDELNNRIKNMKLKDKAYDAFKGNKPVSSTFAEIDNADILASLIEAPAATKHHTASLGNGGSSREGQTELNQSYASKTVQQNWRVPQNMFSQYFGPDTNFEISQDKSYQSADPYVEQNLPNSNKVYSSLDSAPRPLNHLQPKHPSPRRYLASRPVNRMQNSYNSQESDRIRYVSQPDPPLNTTDEVRLDPMRATAIQENVPLVQDTTLRPNQLSPSYSGHPNAPTLKMVSRATSPQRCSSQRGQVTTQTRFPISLRPNLDASQFGTSNEYIQSSPTEQIPLYTPKSDAIRSQQRSVNVSAKKEMAQDYVIDKRQGYYRSSSGNIKASRNFSADVGIEYPNYVEDREDHIEGRERIVIRCRCTEKLRRRRRFCLNSLPCPELRSSCRYCY